MTEARESCREGKIWTGPAMDNMDELKSKWKSIGHYFIHCLGVRFADKILFTDHESGRRWTGAQFKDKVLSVACALVDKYDFQPGTFVCISTPNSDYSLALAIAIICAGGVVACSYPKDPYAELLHLARKVEPKFLFCHHRNIAWAEQLQRDLGHHVEGVSMSATREDGQSANEQFGLFTDLIDYDHKSSAARNRIPVACQDSRKALATVVMSSGTTGKPKAVPHTHWNILADLFCENIASTPDDTFACGAALDYISARVVMFGTIHVGYHTILLNGFEPSTYWDTVHKYRVSAILLGSAPFYELITDARLEECDITSVRTIFVGGAKVIYLDALRRFFGRSPHLTTVHLVYGASEVGMVVSSSVTPQEFLADSSNCGKLGPGLKAKIVDPASGRSLGPNQRGIVHMSSDTVFPGYYDMSLVRARQAEKDKSAGADGDVAPFIRNSEIFDDDGYYILGDYAYFSDKEDLYVIGRQKEVMFCRGAKKVSPQELELVIDQHPVVDKACVMGVDNKREPTLHCPRAFVVPKAKYYQEAVDELKLELRRSRLSALSNGLGKEEEKLAYGGTSEPKVCRMERERRHLIVEDLMRFTNDRVGWEKQLTGGIVLLDDIPTTRGTGKFDKNYLRSLSLDDIELYGDRSG